ncbi:MAG: hypothetical protein KKG47_12765 [Proteobacteria bacterium]|nr:hypothetical protein [Pseudomonadota bacterium]MBU1738724.1 hypothetical protein [Pseudomonadota bacterium]
MPGYIRRLLAGSTVFALALCWATAALAEYWQFPPLPPPHEYGDILIGGEEGEKKVEAVFFSHWSHRLKYSCRVCHLELEFSFSSGGTDITEEDNRNGLYCGACHDGKQAFGHTEENCRRCHTGRLSSSPERFAELTGPLQKAKYGNKVNWSAAIKSGRIQPLYSIFSKDEKALDFSRKLELEAEWPYVPPAYFPHDVHVKWLDCSNCHPDIFNIKKKTTKHFLMRYILEDKFCGVCHLRVAFPLNDCKSCHPAIKNQ